MQTIHVCKLEITTVICQHSWGLMEAHANCNVKLILRFWEDSWIFTNTEANITKIQRIWRKKPKKKHQVHIALPTCVERKCTPLFVWLVGSAILVRVAFPQVVRTCGWMPHPAPCPALGCCMIDWPISKIYGRHDVLTTSTFRMCKLHQSQQLFCSNGIVPRTLYMIDGGCTHHQSCQTFTCQQPGMC